MNDHAQNNRPRQSALRAVGARVMAEDEFTLYDLKVEVIATERPMVCNHREGDYFLLSGENLWFPPDQTFPIYPLAALLPLLPAKQRMTDANDWMTPTPISRVRIPIAARGSG